MSRINKERAEGSAIERERSEFTAIVRRTVKEFFSDVLSDDEVSRRLTEMRAVEFLTQEQMEEVAQKNPKEAGADGFIRYEVSANSVSKYPVVLHSESRAETLHTLAHEATHLISPESVFVTNPTKEPDKQTFSDYLGGIEFERDRLTKEVDPMSVIYDNPRGRALFWESITDWIAQSCLDEVLSQEEKDEIATGGYFERHWIDYLVNESTDRDGLIRAIKESYATGYEDPLIIWFREHSQTHDDEMYNALISIINRPRTEEDRVDDWMSVVDGNFKA
ncbi:MAG: hypothetical protein Q8P30_01270 [Candidatus Uhrbacteria bacterium]|nr:hypothetical protein [Candidatus Uhrbacteria bacterium]